MSVVESPPRFRRLERLANEVLQAIAEVNDTEAIDHAALSIATAFVERALDAVLVILRAGRKP